MLSVPAGLLLPVAEAHSMSVLLISNDVTNRPSMRVCEKLGARLVRVARLPEWTDLYKNGQRFSRTYTIKGISNYSIGGG